MTRTWRVAAWNLNHRIHPKPIPDGVVQAIGFLDLDALVLTEYVDDGGRDDFKAALAGIGLTNLSISQAPPRHNQVLIASKRPHVKRELAIPNGNSHAQSNVLAVRFPEIDLQLVGLRVPAYKKRSELEVYWKGLSHLLQALEAQRFVALGDLNADPRVRRSCGGSYLRQLESDGFQVPEPEGDWSYISSDGTCTSRIDRIIASPEVSISASRYVTQAAGLRIAGPASVAGLSDHAILAAELS